MKFKIGDSVYDVATVNDLTLLMALQLEKETTEFGHPVRLGDIEAMSTTLNALKTDALRSAHPDTPWLLAVTIWAARRLAGEKVTFEEAIDFPMGDLTFLKQPADHARPANPTKRPAKGSGRAAKPRAAGGAKT